MFEDRFELIRKLKNPIPKENRHKYSIKDIKKNGFIKIDDKLYHVLPYGKFFDKKDEWFELKITCIDTGKSTYLEWEEDDELEIFLSIKELDFSDLKDDENEEIDEDDLNQITQEEDDIFFNGKKFEYEDDYKASYLRARDNKKFHIYLYEFEAKNGQNITIENWSNNDERPDYEIWLSKEIPSKSIEIISLGTE